MKYYSVTVHGGECNSYRLRHDSDVNGHEYRPTVCVSGARGDDNQVYKTTHTYCVLDTT